MSRATFLRARRIWRPASKSVRHWTKSRDSASVKAHDRWGLIRPPGAPCAAPAIALLGCSVCPEGLIGAPPAPRDVACKPRALHRADGTRSGTAEELGSK